MILGIETATEICSAAFVRNGKIIAERSVHEKNIHSEHLLVLIDELMKSASISKKEITAIAVSIGPGSFTGLRIGLSTAKGFALALNIPLIAVPTLDGIAEAYRLMNTGTGTEKFYALIDAKRNEAFHALYSVVTNEITRQSEYSITIKDEILQQAQLSHAIVQQPMISAVAVAMLGERRRKEFEVSDFSHLEPLYLRDFVATTPKK